MPDRDVGEMMEANLASHLAHLPGHLEGALVLDEPDLLLASSGVPSDTFNTVCRARLARHNSGDRIAWAIEYFQARKLPFSWWIGPSSTPDDLDQRLVEHGMTFAEAEVAMVLDLSHPPHLPPAPVGLEIRIAATHDELMAYATVIAANWDPPDRWVLDVYDRAATATLAPDSPARYHVGYLDGEPVAASECFLAHGVAGIYNVVTIPRARRRGIGTALTATALTTAHREGYRTAVLQAAAEGLHIYQRLGFIARGEFREYKPY